MFCLLCLVPPLISQEKQETHWSLEPIARPEIPEGGGEVDWFIHRKLKEAGLEQNPPADRHTLLRRASLDLTGLPPTREEIAAFIGDKSDKSWESVVDHLLASPHYGERWGRHWLDVARYVQGTIKVPGIDKIDLAAPYRDYVVRAFNQDKPYDRFIAEQIAGDLLSEKGESSQARLDRITAPAFLSIGPWFEECTDPNKLRLDIIDEQISTATRAFLAHDFACSRCHDHKFDPIPTKDYYALAGIFRSTEITSQFSNDWKDGRPRSVIPLAEQKESREHFMRQVHLFELITKRRDHLETLFLTKVRLREEFPAPAKLPNEILFFEAEDFAGHKNLKTSEIGPGKVIRTRKAIERWVKYRVVIPEPGDYSLVVRYAADSPSPAILELDLKDQQERVLGKPTYGELPENFSWHPLPLRNLEKGSLHIRFKVNPNEPFPVLDCFRLVKGVLDPEDTEWRRLLGEPSLADTPYYLNVGETKSLREREDKIASLRNSVTQLDLTLGVRDASTPVNLPVHIGGDVYKTEPFEIRRAVPSLGLAPDPERFGVEERESGRRQFADWLTDPGHPLTARVMVNRIWHWHFGIGLVRTTDDFGKQGSSPTHPDLLDWLAAEFVESSWSIKHIHRLILLSDTYRASSELTPENREQDADGSLLSRFPKRRLEVEAIYDSMLTSIGKVPRQEPGQPLDTSRSKDRALYILTSSRSPMGLGLEIRKMFPLFGFDSSGRPIHDRDESITPEQALWWLNNPLPEYYASQLAERILTDHYSPTERVRAVHEIALGRPPGEKSGLAFLTYIDQLTDDGLSEPEAWSRACLGLFSTRSFQTLE
ncbi:MAG: DUF1549 domain-containing protein [Verrucomicrobiales bacterium]|nr:DUF1549 domain-containing protein [Verrucomicrobiales bacterium]